MSIAETRQNLNGTTDGRRVRAFSIAGSFERATFYGLLLIVLLAAVPNGTVEVWHKAAIISMIALAAFFRIAEGLASGRFRIAEPVLLAPLVGVVLLAVLQCVPWSTTGTIVSLDLYETKAFILIFGSLIVFGEMLFAYANSLHRLNVLAGLVLTVAAASSIFGFLWEMAEGSGYNFMAAYIRPHQGYAQFINRNHFAVLVEMALGLLAGLLLRAELNEVQRFFGWVLAGGLIYSIIAAGSRGGLVSLIGLTVFAVFLHVFTNRPERGESPGDDERKRIYRRSNRLAKFFAASGICAILIGIIVFMIAFVGGDRLASRFEKVEAEVTTFDGASINRNLIWASTLDLIVDKPVFGVGFGAYEAAITNYDLANGKAALKQAHNEYLEIMANGGLVGALLFLAFGGLVCMRIRQVLASPDRLRVAHAFGAAVGIFGVLVHSIVDFGLHVIVNAFLFVVLIVLASADVKGLKVGENRFASKDDLQFL